MSCLFQSLRHTQHKLNHFISFSNTLPLHTPSTRTFAVYKKHEVKISVTLQSDVDKLGYTGQTVQVARGYARNYLLPRKLAIYTYIKTNQQANPKKLLHHTRTNTIESIIDDNNKTSTPSVTQYDIQQRQWNESMKQKLSRVTIQCKRQSSTGIGNINDVVGNEFIGSTIDSKHIYSKLLKLYPDISTQLYSDRINIPSGTITQFGTFPVHVQLYPVLHNQPIQIQVNVTPA